MTIDKNTVRKRFMRSAQSYDQNAVAQKQIATHLAQLLDIHQIQAETIFEFGCGSGFLTKLITERIHPKKLFLNDLYPLQIALEQALVNTNFLFHEGDAECMKWDDSYDLITSSSTLQWFSNTEEFFKKCYSNLNPNGILAFSTFLPGNLKEIRQITGVGLNYLSAETIQNMLSPYFEIIAIKDETLILHFPSALQVLKHFRSTGVNGISKAQWSKRDLASFTTSYEKYFKTSKGFSLSYKPLYIIARKK